MYRDIAQSPPSINEPVEPLVNPHLPYKPMAIVDAQNVSPETIEKHTDDSITQTPISIVTVENVESRHIDQSPDSPPIDEFQDNSQVPKYSPIRLFWFFLWRFGFFAWGGPVAQIALIKEQLVIRQKWITIPRFNRAFAVYQILPGPEAAELCGIAAGIGFILPGFVLMLVASYVYVLVGFENKYVNASFRALQPLVAAMILRATHKIAEHTFLSHETKKINPILFLSALLTALNTTLRINWFISLGIYGIINAFYSRRWYIPAAGVFVLQYVGFALYVVYKGVPSPISFALGIAPTPDNPHLLALGLVAGSLSFGGAYTSIPVIQAEAVVLGGWLSQRVFLDCIAIGNVLPAPLVIFATFVGFQGGYVYGGLGSAFAGAILITLGMFMPCFIFTIAGHELLEKLVRNKTLAAFFDGVCGAVVGVVAIVAADLLEASVNSPGFVPTPSTEERLKNLSDNSIAAVLYMLTLSALYKFTNKYTAIVLVVVGALAGQYLFL